MLSIQLPGVMMPQLLLTEGQYVGQVIDAIIAKFKDLEGIKADQVQLFNLDGSSQTPLNPTHLLSAAGLVTGTSLVVKLTVTAQALMEGVWEELVGL